MFTGSIKKISNIERVTENKPAALKCALPFETWPEPEFRWENASGQPIIDSRMTEGPNGTLYISNIEQNDNNTQFTCYITLESEEISISHNNTMILVVDLNSVPPESAPIKQYAERNVSAVVNGSIEIYCIYGGSPPPKIVWKRNDKEIEYNDRFQLGSNNRSLYIKNVNIDDDGPFECDVLQNKSSEGIWGFTSCLFTLLSCLITLLVR